MQNPNASNMDWEFELRNALENGEFSVFYMPLIEVQDGSTAGFEALVRWEHPEMGMFTPSKFLGAAEVTGMIVPIGEWVLSTACRQVKQWQEEFGLRSDLTVGVNFSAEQMRHPQLINTVERVLTETSLPAACLIAEVSERTLMRYTSVASEVMHGLHRLGVTMAMDDFGLGYSSLGALNKFPLDYLKLDRPFVQSLVSDSENLRIASTIVSLTDRLGISTIAEGVEDAKIAEKLDQIQCRYAQGYHYSSPLDTEGVGKWLAREAARTALNETLRLAPRSETLQEGRLTESLPSRKSTSDISLFPAL